MARFHTCKRNCVVFSTTSNTASIRNHTHVHTHTRIHVHAETKMFKTDHGQPTLNQERHSIGFWRAESVQRTYDSERYEFEWDGTRCRSTVCTRRFTMCPAAEKLHELLFSPQYSICFSYKYFMMLSFTISKVGRSEWIGECARAVSLPLGKAQRTQILNI